MKLKYKQHMVKQSKKYSAWRYHDLRKYFKKI